jgi:hypothetical protein
LKYNQAVFELQLVFRALCVVVLRIAYLAEKLNEAQEEF